MIIDRKQSGDYVTAADYNSIADAINMPKQLIELKAGFTNKIGRIGYPDYLGNLTDRVVSFGNLQQLDNSLLTKSAVTSIHKTITTGIFGTGTFKIKAGVVSSKFKTPTIVNPYNGSSIQLNNTGYSRKNEYIHPGIAYTSTGIAGYKYWIIASNYPAELPDYEDEDLLVSNDAVNWYRVLPESLESDGTKPVLPVNGFGITSDNGRENSFIPITRGGVAITMNGSQFTPVVSLKHDPEIIINNGEVFVYLFYNFYEDSAKTIFHRFVNVVSTTNGRTWYINRTDGSKIEATQANLQELFTQSTVDGKNNYIRYFNNSTTGTDLIKDTAMQVVYDGVDWWAYYGQYSTYTNSNIGLKRYKGTSHLNFDWTQSWFCTADKVTDKTQHWDVKYYNSKYYVFGRHFIYESADGITFAESAHIPNVVVPGSGYKVATCIGENNEFVYVLGTLLSGNLASNGADIDKPQAVASFITKYTDFAEYIDYATNGGNAGGCMALISRFSVENTGEFQILPLNDLMVENLLNEYSINIENIEESDIISVFIVSAIYDGIDAENIKVILSNKIEIQ